MGVISQYLSFANERCQTRDGNWMFKSVIKAPERGKDQNKFNANPSQGAHHNKSNNRDPKPATKRKEEKTHKVQSVDKPRPTASTKWVWTAHALSVCRMCKVRGYKPVPDSLYSVYRYESLSPSSRYHLLSLVALSPD